MRLKMAKNSLFAILLRKPWWVSLSVASLLSVVAVASLPRESAVYGLSAGVPFLLICLVAAYRQFRAPNPARVTRTVNMATAMSSREFMDAVEDGFRRDGFEVRRLTGNGADFELKKAGRTALVSCKRWKAVNTGIELLRTLQEAAEAQGAQDRLYIAVGQLTENAWQYVSEKKIHVVGAEGLATLLQHALRAKERR
jgi:restriction system protein